MTGEARFVKITLAVRQFGEPDGQGGGVKKDEKSRENQLTGTSIFDTMIKHLSRRLKCREERVDPEKAGRNKNRKKFKKRVDKKPHK